MKKKKPIKYLYNKIYKLILNINIGNYVKMMFLLNRFLKHINVKILNIRLEMKKILKVK